MLANTKNAKSPWSEYIGSSCEKKESTALKKAMSSNLVFDETPTRDITKKYWSV